jgi:hypothetical protein
MPKSNRGGRRAGAGRKPSKVKPIKSAILDAIEQGNLAALPGLFAVMGDLARGGIPQVEEEFRVDGDAPKTADADAAEGPKLVLHKRRVTHTLPDRAAAAYLIDRVIGRPVQAVTAADAAAPPDVLVFLEAIAKVYGAATPAGPEARAIPCDPT